MNKEKDYWVDTYLGCIVGEKEINQPPERYFKAIRGDLDFYKDTWKLSDGRLIDFAWSEEDKEYWNLATIEHFNKHRVGDLYSTAILIKRVYPANVFDELLEVNENDR